MKKADLIGFGLLFVIILAAIITFTITKNNWFQSFALGTTGPALGSTIGYFIRDRNQIIDRRKFKIDMFVLSSIAVGGSVSMCLFLDLGEMLEISIVSLNAAMIAAFLLRNIRNVRVIR
ncbi:hypothetical protein EYV94_10485 [Puteibacter caeruleilacunae]|nr:hypothetical protein EYV94_10485 [Puteibacter caeruleilacunae]